MLRLITNRYCTTNGKGLDLWPAGLLSPLRSTKGESPPKVILAQLTLPRVKPIGVVNSGLSVGRMIKILGGPDATAGALPIKSKRVKARNNRIILMF